MDMLHNPLRRIVFFVFDERARKRLATSAPVELSPPLSLPPPIATQRPPREVSMVKPAAERDGRAQ